MLLRRLILLLANLAMLPIFSSIANAQTRTQAIEAINKWTPTTHYYEQLIHTHERIFGMFDPKIVDGHLELSYTSFIFAEPSILGFGTMLSKTGNERTQIEDLQFPAKIEEISFIAYNLKRYTLYEVIFDCDVPNCANEQEVAVEDIVDTPTATKNYNLISTSAAKNLSEWVDVILRNGNSKQTLEDQVVILFQTRDEAEKFIATFTIAAGKQ